MKTNQVMTIKIMDSEIEVHHKTMMGKALDIMSIGNKCRALKGMKPLRLDTILGYVGTKNFVDSIKRKYNIEYSDIVSVSGKGKASVTYIYLPLMIYIAEQLDSDFHVEVIDTFIRGNILGLRDQGGNDFKRLNNLIDTLPDRIKKAEERGISIVQCNKMVYINVSKMIRLKVFTPEQLEECKENGVNIWNSEHATDAIQNLRTEYENKLCTLIEMGACNSYDELKEYIGRL